MGCCPSSTYVDHMEKGIGELFEGVEKDFVHLRNTLYFLISFSCNHNIPTCKNMSACKVLYVFAILLVFAQAFALSFMKFIT